MAHYLINFNLHGAENPPGDLYTSIYREIEVEFGPENYCKDFLGFCLVRTEISVAELKNRVRTIVNKKSNRFSSMDLVVFSLGKEISISRGKQGSEDLRDFRKFFVS